MTISVAASKIFLSISTYYRAEAQPYGCRKTRKRMRKMRWKTYGFAHGRYTRKIDRDYEELTGWRNVSRHSINATKQMRKGEIACLRCCVLSGAQLLRLETIEMYEAVERIRWLYENSNLWRILFQFQLNVIRIIEARTITFRKNISEIYSQNRTGRSRHLSSRWVRCIAIVVIKTR